MSLSREEKERILRSLEEDREFRHAIMGLLGFSEILERITRLEEEFLELRKAQQRLEERFAELEKHFARLEERQQKLEERVARVEERMVKVEERLARVEEILAKHGELLSALFDEVKKLKSNVGALGRRLGKGFEALLREAYRDLLSRIGVEGYEVQHMKYVDIDGKYLAPGSTIEVDIVVKDGQLWLLEVKSYVEEKDVSWFHNVAQAAEKILGRKADRKILLGVIVDKEAYEYAKKLGIEMVYVSLAED